jgi:hypothetical protein
VVVEDKLSCTGRVGDVEEGFVDGFHFPAGEFVSELHEGVR